MRKLLTLFTALLFVGSMWAVEVTFYSETFGTPTGNTNVTAYSGWSAQGITYGGTAKVGVTTSNICNITGSSASGYLYMSNNSTIKDFDISGINTSGYTTIKLSYNYRGAANTCKYSIYYSTDGENYTALSTNNSCTNTWRSKTESSELPAASNLRIRISNATSNYAIYFDDLKITGTSTSIDPSIIANPNPVNIDEAETSSTIDLTYLNITNYLADISLHDDAAGQESFTGNWLDAEIDDTDYATISYMAGANLGAARTAYIKVYATGDNDAEVTLIIPVTQAAHVPVVTAVSNNDDYGTVAKNNNVITATSNAGYRIDDDAPYTVTIGTATVVRGTGNKTNQFTVTPSTDCTIQINFEAIPQHTVTWNVNGETSTSQVYEGSKPTFPATPSAFDATSNTFYGWATANWNGKINDLAGKTIHRKARTMPEVIGPVEYFAVFAVENATNSGWFETAIENLAASDIFVLADQSNYAMTNDKGTSDAPDAVVIAVTDGKITSAIPDKLQWNISGNATDGYTFYPEGSTTTWLYCNTTAASGSNNNMRVGNGNRKVFELDDEGILMTKDDNTTRYVCRYSNSDYRGYINKDNGEPIEPKLYKYVAPLYSDYITTELDPTSLEDVEESVKAVKVLRNGILLIEKNGHTYNAQGQLVK